MSSKCTPPLQFVQNGPAGSAFPPPLDPNDVPHVDTQPTFEQTACTVLGAGLCSAMDPISAIDELPALADAVDVLTTAQDANLDAILLELDQLGEKQVNDAFDAFSAAQPAAEGMVMDVQKLQLPALGSVPLVNPSGQVQVNLGAAPSQGGAAAAGGAPYVLHVPLAWRPGSASNVTFVSLTGPDPPIAGFAGLAEEPDAQGTVRYTALIHISPAHAGAFNGVVHVKATVTVAGVTMTVTNNVPFTVIVEG